MISHRSVDLASRVSARRVSARRVCCLLVILGVAASGCASTAAPRATASPPAAAGFETLFDGSSLDAWRGYRMEGLPAGWTIEGDKLRFAPPAEGTEGAAGAPVETKRADLITRKQYDDFELRLEWAITPGGNSGIFFRIREDQPQSYFSAPEVQVLDNDGHRDGQNPKTSAGSNYAIHAPTSNTVRPLGQFNEVVLRVNGGHVQQWLNGVKTVDYRLWTKKWRELVAGSKFAAWPVYGLSMTGHIGLQDHGNEVWFRNIRIRRLRESARGSGQ